MERIAEQIRAAFGNMTAGQRKVAEYFLADPARIALHSAKEAGELTGTSEATVFRFCRSIGYPRYSALQEAVRAELLRPKRRFADPFGAYGASAAREPEDAAEYLAHLQRQDALQVERTLAGVQPETLARAAEAIRSAAGVVVIGLRASYAAAHWFSYALNVLRGGVELYRGGSEDGQLLLSRLEPDWTVVALSFPRYMRETLDFVREAKWLRARIIAITDHELAPIALQADLLLKVEAPPPESLRGMPAVFSLLGALAGYLSVIDRERVGRRLDEYRQAREYSFYFADSGSGES